MDSFDLPEPEIINSYKANGQEIKVITGRNPKCPPGYKIIKTDINNSISDTKVIICAKEDMIIKPQKPNVNELDPNDVLSLAVTNDDYDNFNFPFTVRDDAFVSGNKNNLSTEFWTFILLIIIFILYLVNTYKEKNIDVSMSSVKETSL